MQIWWVFYGVLTAGMVAAAWSARQREPSLMAVAFAMALTWAISNVSHIAFVNPETLFPTMDAIVALWLIRLWSREGYLWQFLLMILFAFDGTVHAIFSGVHSYGYALALNLVYLLQLAVVTWRAVAPIREAPCS